MPSWTTTRTAVDPAIRGDVNRAAALGRAMSRRPRRRYGAFHRRFAAARGIALPSNRRPRGLSLADQYEQKYNQARQANIDRYNAIRGGSDDQTAALGGYLGRYRRGVAAADRNVRGAVDRYSRGMTIADAASGQQYKQMASAAGQDLVSRGLANTTEAARAKFDAFERSQATRLAAHDRLSGDVLAADRARNAVESGLSQDTLAFQERREDEYPDLNQMIALHQASGAAGPGGYGYGGRGGIIGAPLYMSPAQLGYRLPNMTPGGSGRQRYRTRGRQRIAGGAAGGGLDGAVGAVGDALGRAAGAAGGDFRRKAIAAGWHENRVDQATRRRRLEDLKTKPRDTWTDSDRDFMAAEEARRKRFESYRGSGTAPPPDINGDGYLNSIDLNDPSVPTTYASTMWQPAGPGTGIGQRIENIRAYGDQLRILNQIKRRVQQTGKISREDFLYLRRLEQANG